MPTMEELYKRRVRIESGPDDTHGYLFTVHDADTGEEITHVARAVITLDVRHDNIAELTYFGHAEDGKLTAGADGKPVVKTITVKRFDVRLCAFERFDPPFYTHQNRAGLKG